MRQLLYLFISLLLCVSQVSWGAKQNLYQTTVPVASRAPEQYQQALRLALQQVLVKVSGSRAVASLPILELAQKQASKFVQAYRYIEFPAEKTQKKELSLQVEFEPTAIKQLLQQAGQNIWGTERPVLIAWLAIDNEEAPQLISETSPVVPQLIRQAAEQRGIAILLPVLDLEDMTQISIQTIWQTDVSTLRTVSQRYSTDAIISARILQRDDHTWQADWTLLLGLQSLNWSHTADTKAALIQMGVDELADVLASRFAVNEKQPSEAQLTVFDVESAEDYTRVLAYLRSLTSVTDVQVRSVGDNQVVYDVRLSSQLSAFLKALTSQPLLVPVENPVATENARLTYRLVT